jgi:hypothetical protein
LARYFFGRSVPTPSEKTVSEDYTSRSGRANGVQNPVPEDTALVHDTRNILHYKPLPKRNAFESPIKQARRDSRSEHSESLYE